MDIGYLSYLEHAYIIEAECAKPLKLKQALEFYGKASNWFGGKLLKDDFDIGTLNTPHGRRAREALEGLEEGV